MVPTEEMIAILEIGTVTLESGAQITYPSREAYYRHYPRGAHTVQWRIVDPTHLEGKTTELLEAEANERDAAARKVVAEEKVAKAKENETTASIPDPIAPIINNHTWVEAIASHPLNIRSEFNSAGGDDLFWFNKKQYLKNAANILTAGAEKIRGIELSHGSITLGGITKPVLVRDAIKAKKALTPEQLDMISHFEFLALWNTSAAAAYKMADDLNDPGKRIKFKAEIDKLIDRNVPRIEPEHGKDIYLRKMQSLFSVLGAFHPNQTLKTLSERLEAERDLLAIEDPSEIVATYHQNGDDPNELVYEVEIPNTKLSDDQILFFTMAAETHLGDDDIAFNYEFYGNLEPWQQKLIRREANNILQGNRLRPSQMQFLPMAPNFWTRYTTVKDNSGKVTIVNEISRCGALSPRIDATEEGIIQFQEMQYSQVRENFGLETDDKLCYTSYKQNFYGLGADDSALKNITKAHENEKNPQFAEDNHIYNIPMGRFSWVSRVMNVTHNFFFENKFENNKDDPLTQEAFSAVELILNLRSCRDRDNPLSIDIFLNSTIDFAHGETITEKTKSLIKEIKLDLEQIYRHAMEIEQLRYGSLILPNLRIATLRTVMFDELTKVKAKCEKLPGMMYQRKGTKSIKLTYQAYISGCKSNIDRGTLVAHHTEVLALKEHRRRCYWNKTYQTPTHTPSWLNTKSFVVRLLLNIPIVRSFFSFCTQYFSGASLKQLNEKYAIATMERDVAVIDTAMSDNKSKYNLATHTGKMAYQQAQAPLLRKRAEIINNAINSNVSIEAAVCQGGHARTMPAHGGSTNVTGIKDGVVAAVASNLEEHNVHLISQNKLSSHNHHLYEKSDVDDRAWVMEEHREAAQSQYTPPAYVYLDPSNSIKSDKGKSNIISFSELPFANVHDVGSINSPGSSKKVK